MMFVELSNLFNEVMIFPYQESCQDEAVQILNTFSTNHMIVQAQHVSTFSSFGN